MGNNRAWQPTPPHQFLETSPQCYRSYRLPFCDDSTTPSLRCHVRTWILPRLDLESRQNQFLLIHGAHQLLSNLSLATLLVIAVSHFRTFLLRDCSFQTLLAQILVS